MRRSWALHGTGAVPSASWATLHAATHTWTSAWADVDGFHLEPFPATAPATTHLWAWTTSRWLRVRVDGDTWWAGLLTADDSSVDGPWTCPERIPDVDIAAVRHWRPTEGQVRQFRGDPRVLSELAVRQLVPLRPTTATFIGDADSVAGLEP